MEFIIVRKRKNHLINITTKRKQRKFFSAFLFYTTLKCVCSKVEDYEPNQAFNGKKSKPCPSHALEPLFKL
ncbi:hypothetical protein M2372_002140 [Chryseobacterium sp. BIGb0232]|nr:hypothetical protein [Chryseobacterium sp. BIGb0232]